VTQVATPPTDAFEAGEFTVEWINLGQATDAEIRTAAETMDFADIFEFEEPNATAPWCNTGYTSVHTYNHECLKLKTGMEIIASRLEMRRYAAMLGATVEFNKMEGISLDIKNNKMYLGMSAVDKGMLDSPTNYDKGESHYLFLSVFDSDIVFVGIFITVSITPIVGIINCHRFYQYFYYQHILGGNAQIAVPKNSCGCVYELAMDASYAVITIKPTVCGKAGTVGDSNNACDVNNIANPDNIWYDNKYELLFIAEDTSKHQNDVMWQYEQTTGVLTRILSSPYGSEITSTEFHHWGECDIMEIVFQHPYGETDRAMLLEKGNSGEEAYLSYMRMPKITASATSASSSATRLGTSLFLGMISLSVILCVL
jgi:secreted PhoX family phosphatase